MFRSLRSLGAALAVSACLALGACNPAVIPAAVATDSPIALPGGAVVKPSAVIERIQSATVKACRFLPSAQFLGNVAATFTNYDQAIAYASTVAASICAQVSPTVVAGGKYVSLRRVPHEERLRGVPIEGRFVN